MRTFHRRRLLILFPILGLILDPRLHEIHLTVRLLASTQVRPASAVAYRKVHDHIGARLVTQHLLRTEVAAVVIELIDLLQRKQHMISSRLTGKERKITLMSDPFAHLTHLRSHWLRLFCSIRLRRRPKCDGWSACPRHRGGS